MADGRPGRPQKEVPNAHPLRAALQAAGKTQSEAARFLEVSDGTLSNWLTRRYPMPKSVELTLWLGILNDFASYSTLTEAIQDKGGKLELVKGGGADR